MRISRGKEGGRGEEGREGKGEAEWEGFAINSVWAHALSCLEQCADNKAIRTARTVPQAVS